MANAGLIKKDTALSAYIKVRCANAADKRLADAIALEKAMIAALRESDPDAEGWMVLSLRRLNQRLLDEGHSSAPESLRMLLKSLEFDGKGLAGKRGSLELKYRDKDHYAVKLQRDWAALTETAEKRQAVAGIVLKVIADQVPKGGSGEVLVEFSESELIKALREDLFLAPRIKDFTAATERGLLYLHEQRAIILQQGLAVFRSAMSITILPSAKGRRFTMGDYSSLREHYRERVFQIHVMNRYADLGLADTAKAAELVRAYFTMAKARFVKKFFPGEKEMLERATSAESYQRIVEHLNNGVQTAIVSARPTENMLVLAGPGSGKTRVIAHRCAYLLKVERVRSREILVVCFNRAAALSLRRRIRDLAGKDAIGVTVQTYHALAMRLIGASLAERSERQDGPPNFDEMIRTATAMIRGEHDILGLEPDEMRERLLAGYRHILIDEYQDINQDQYDMISAIAGRTLDSNNQDARLSILAVGDDDQNIYSFQGANIRFIRQFEQDYSATPHYLVENYRSTANIIAAANQLIDCNTDRMKRDQPIRINKARANEPVGEPVRVVPCRNILDQARSALKIIQQHRGESIAVFARTNRELHPILAATHAAGIDAALAASKRGAIHLHRTRETRALIQFLKELEQKTITAERVKQVFHAMPFHSPDNPWCRATDKLLDEWAELTFNDARSPYDVTEFLYEASHEARREQTTEAEVLLSTAHAAKGLEFDHVIMLGDWKTAPDEEERRLYYVGMTRARKTLVLCELDGKANPFAQSLKGPHVRHNRAESPAEEPSDAVLQTRFSTLSPADIWINYPATSRGVQHAITAVNYGDQVKLDQQNQRIYIRDQHGHKIGAFSAAASKKWGPRLGSIQEARIHSIINWKKEFSNRIEENAADEWELPLLEIKWNEASAQQLPDSPKIQ